MTFSIYTASVPVFTRMLTNLEAILGKAEAWATERKIEPAVLFNARLAPDMLPLSSQITSATDHAKFGSARLAGRTPPVWADTETTFAELHTRLRTAIDYLGTFTLEDFAEAPDREVTVKVGGKDTPMTGATYLFTRAMPNFFFHTTTAYAILRHNGVPIGKRDYLG
ncbi:MAG: hypothetical protein JWR75_464 [Devosia sp.]|nr:hypothetical protein [Devosia sp.]